MVSKSKSGSGLDDRLISLKIASDLLGVSRRTIERMIHHGELHKVKVRGRSLVRASDVSVIMQTQAKGGVA